MAESSNGYLEPDAKKAKLEQKKGQVVGTVRQNTMVQDASGISQSGDEEDATVVEDENVGHNVSVQDDEEIMEEDFLTIPRRPEDDYSSDSVASQPANAKSLQQKIPFLTSLLQERLDDDRPLVSKASRSDRSRVLSKTSPLLASLLKERPEEARSSCSKASQPETRQDHFVAEEQAALMISTSNPITAIDLLEDLKPTQRQQMLLFVSYCKIGEKTEASRCIETARRLMANSLPRPLSKDVYNLGVVNMTRKRPYRAMYLFSCASKLYALKSDASEAIDGLMLCCQKGVQGLQLVTPIAKHRKSRFHLLAFEIAYVFFNEMIADLAGIETDDETKKEKAKAVLYNSWGVVLFAFTKHEKCSQVFKLGVDIMLGCFGPKAAEHKIHGDLLNNLGKLYHASNQMKKAVDWYKQAGNAWAVALDFTNEQEQRKTIEVMHKCLRRALGQLGVERF